MIHLSYLIYCNNNNSGIFSLPTKLFVLQNILFCNTIIQCSSNFNAFSFRIINRENFQEKNIEAEPLSQTYYWWDETEFEDIDNNSSPIIVPNLEMKRVVHGKLAPCTYVQCCDQEPVPQGCYRMEISVDMMEQLTQLFGIFFFPKMFKI